jgi:hypothetical protein
MINLIDIMVKRLAYLVALRYVMSNNGALCLLYYDIGCDEHLAGSHPSRGTELCTVVETMFSYEVSLLSMSTDQMHVVK